MHILGVRLDLLTTAQVREAIEQQLLQPGGGLYIITTVNAECLALASGEPAYRDVLNRASLNVIDGVGVAWIARLRGQRPVERIPGSELIYDLARLCQAHKKRLFLLGAAPTVAGAAQERLRQLHPGLEVEAYSPPPVSSHRLPPSKEEALLQKLLAFSPQVVCVALGMPKQELWISENRQHLEELGVRIAIGVGGAVDFVAGAVPRAPAFMRWLGLEWLYRLAREPGKRFRRQVTRLPRFLVLASLEALRLRLKGEPPAAGPS